MHLTTKYKDLFRHLSACKAFVFSAPLSSEVGRGEKSNPVTSSSHEDFASSTHPLLRLDSCKIYWQGPALFHPTIFRIYLIQYKIVSFGRPPQPKWKIFKIFQATLDTLPSFFPSVS